MSIKGDRKMTNGAKFSEVFNDYATEIWSKPMKEFLEWLDAPTVSHMNHERWIPCEECMPEEPFGCLVTVMDTEPMTGEEFENILPYFVGWDGEQWNDGDGYQCPFEVLAWMQLPEPYMMDDVGE